MPSMRRSPVTKLFRGAGRLALLLLTPILGSVACTSLTETPTSSITPETFYSNETEVLGGLAGVYSQLRNTLWAYYNLSEISTDEMVVPTRGQDWYDNGRWLEIHRQLWGANSPSGLEDVNGAWVDAFTGVARSNVLLEALQKVSFADRPGIEAELRTLRAFYYYMLMDMFGGVPIVTTTEIVPRERKSRAELFAFIETELKAARDVLPSTRPATDLGRFTKGSANAILANMYLNAEDPQLRRVQPAHRLAVELPLHQPHLAREHPRRPPSEPVGPGPPLLDAAGALQPVQPFAVERLLHPGGCLQRVRRRRPAAPDLPGGAAGQRRDQPAGQ